MRKVVVALLIAILCSVNGDTDPTDASTLNSLFTSLNSPVKLTKWKSSGGDPCGESWKGITCSGPRVTEINIPGLGLTGNMGYRLNTLTSVTSFDISNNQLGNQIPLQLPPNVQKLNLAGNGFVASLPVSLSQMASLKYLNVSHNQIEGPVTISFAALTSLSTLDLSFNGMTGNLPESFQSLKSVTDMYLQNNQFAGTIDILANLPLENLNIENNRFSGWIPERFKSINLQSKGNLFNSSPAPPAPPGTPPAIEPHQNHKSGGNSVSSKSTSRKSGIAAVAVIAGIIILALILAAILALIMIKRQRRSRKSPPDTKKLDDLPFTPPPQVQEMMSVENSLKNSSKSSKAPILRPQPVDRHKGFETDNISLQPIVAPKKVNRAPINVKHYSVADLQIATDSFCVENFIGEGSVGPVYRAHLDNGQVVAVKKINSSSVSNSEDFLDIVSDISRLHHPNISELVGYCCEHGQHLLVYEFLKNGSLYENLYFSDEYSKPLTWNSRVKIAIGAAKGLEYIHEVCSPPSIHQNFKSENILLDAQLNARITDCGLACLVRPDQVPGYSAPEVATSGRYTVKSDVYSFGVVMLELLTGRKPFDSSRARSEQSLVRWATPQLHDIDALTKMVDPALNGLFPVKSLSYFADIIALCVQPEPEFRPPMSEVVESLVRLVQRASMSRRTLGGDSLSRRESMMDVERYISP